MKSKIARYFLLVFFFLVISTLGFLFLLINDTEKDIRKLDDNFLINDYKILNNKILKKENQIGLYKRLNCVFKNFITKGLSCIKSFKNSNIYIPFDLVRKKFDLIGKLDEDEQFRIEFTDSPIFSPVLNYNSSNQYLWFSRLNVESRERVKFLSLKHGVPVSSQWQKSGHFYPVQVAQFGLSHFSKWCEKKTKKFYKQKLLLDSKNKFLFNDDQNVYLNSIENGFEFRFPDKAIYKTDYNFDIRYLDTKVYTESFMEFIIDLMLRDQSLQPGGHIIRLVYHFNSSFESKEENFEKILNPADKSFKIIYKLNSIKTIHVIRNLCLDACKGLNLKCDNCFKSLNETLVLNNASMNSHVFMSQYFKVYQIGLKGEGKIVNGSLAENVSNLDLSKLAADYLVYSQNQNTGGWPINITRKFDSKSKIHIKPGWYSAMAQGHALSLLCRFYSLYREDKFYKSALKALDLFEVDSEQNGIRAFFLNTSLTWYEEYPTRPFSLFVLNGFIYSLFGINDFINSCLINKPENEVLKAKNLFLNGLKSLTQLINLYDTGTRSFYDLRHLSDPSINPNVARWDYHTLHVSQLNYLVNMLENLDKSKFDRNLMLKYSSDLKTVAQRWLNYTYGIWYQNSQIKESQA